MRSASIQSLSGQPSSFGQPPSLRQRAVAGAIAIAINVALVIMLLSFASSPPRRPKEDVAPLAFSLVPERSVTATRAHARVRRAAAAAAPRPTPAPSPATAPTPHSATTPWNVMTVTSAEYAASDISRLPRASAAAAPGGGAGSGTDGASASGPGDGPGGARLYDVQWYRRPTNAELATYLPHNLENDDWGMIACQTIERYHVDNCRELADSRTGSGLARAIREAAWQFLVRPPRVGDRPILGAWVRIRVDMTMVAAK